MRPAYKNRKYEKDSYREMIRRNYNDQSTLPWNAAEQVRDP
jgi:hypothetical protein